jgi:NTE family protein
MSRALVLAGGGVAGIAWELGVLLGIQDADPGLSAQLLAADVVVGTSAGSAVAAQVTSGVQLATLYEAQLAEATSELHVEVNAEELFAKLTLATQNARSPQQLRQALGEIALATDTVDEASRLVAVAARLPVPSWPARELLLPAIDAQSGEVVVFSPTSGVRLVDAVAASCAVPGVWPPVSIAGRRYIDGGVRSGTNADLAAGADEVLIITPTMPGTPAQLGASLDEELALLAPARVAVVYADEESLAAFGTNPLSPNTRAASARAGRAIGRAQAAAIVSALAGG